MGAVYSSAAPVKVDPDVHSPIDPLYGFPEGRKPKGDNLTNIS